MSNPTDAAFDWLKTARLPAGFGDKDREYMHRRAQKAESALIRSGFWIRCIEKWASENGELYLEAISKQAIKEIGPKEPTP